MVNHCNNDDRLYRNLKSIDSCIRSRWHIHNSSLKDFKEEVSNTFDKAISVLKVEDEYSDDSSPMNLNTDTVTINIKTNTLTINTVDVSNLYKNLKQISDSADLPIEVKTELNELINQGLDNPKDVGLLKKICTRFHEGLKNISPEISAISSVLGIFGTLM